MMKNVVACLLLLGGVLTGTGCDRGTAPLAPVRDIGTVDLIVDFGDQPNAPQKIEVVVPCSVDSTVFTTMQRALQNGDLKMEASGTGETAFIHSINGVAGDAGTGNYWFFFLNDQLAQLGAGMAEVDPGDQVRWSYQVKPANFPE